MAGRFDQAVLELRALLEMDLTLGDSWRDLARTFDKMGRPDEARLSLSPLVILGVATPKETELVRSGIPREAPPLRAGAFDLPLLVSLGGYGSAERAASELLVTLEPALAKLYPPDLEAFGLTTRDKITTKTGHPLRVLSDRVAAAVGVAEYELFIHRARSRGLSVELSHPPAVLIPAGAADLPVAQQVFVLCRPLAMIALRFQAAAKLTPRELEVLLASAARAVAPGYGAGLTSEDFLEDQQKRIQRALPRKSRKAMEEAAERYVKAQGLDFPRWVARMDRAVARVALVLANELVACVDVLRRTERDLADLDGMSLARQSEVVADLLHFWMSDAAVQLRIRAGLLPPYG
jgi:hypothetical protein